MRVRDLRAVVSLTPAQAANPPFFVPDHLAPRCNSCKAAADGVVHTRYAVRTPDTPSQALAALQGPGVGFR